MDCLGPRSPVRRVVVMKGAQVGATECGNNWVGYIIQHAPAPTLMVLPTVEVARRVSKQRIAPMIEATPVLRGRVRDARARDSGNTLSVKEFDGGILILTGANSAAGLRSMPIRNVFMDEIDEYPGDVDDQGDPIALAEERAATFGSRAKFFLPSTPTVKGVSRIEAEYLASDQRRFLVPCPECGHEDFLTWQGRDHITGQEGLHWRFEWEDGKPHTAKAICPNCNARVGEAHKTRMLAAGRWVPMNPDGPHRGYHLSALYSPWKTWGDCARQIVMAGHDPMRTKSFVNMVLGEPWEERAAVDPATLAGRREPYDADVPDGVAVLTCAVDVQGDRLEVMVNGWGQGEESWLVSYHQEMGDPGTDAVWRALDDFLKQGFKRADGTKLHLSGTAVDAGAYSEAVYKFCKARQERRVFAVKGGPSTGLPLAPRRASRVGRVGARLFVLCTDTGKEIIQGRYQIPTPGPGYLHLPDWVDEEFIQQLVAERPLRKWTPGRGTTRVWEKIRDRNEAFDLEVYALACLYILWPPGPRLERALVPRPGQPAEPEPQPEAAVSVVPAALRKRIRPGWVNRWRN